MTGQPNNPRLGWLIAVNAAVLLAALAVGAVWHFRGPAMRWCARSGFVGPTRLLLSLDPTLANSEIDGVSFLAFCVIQRNERAVRLLLEAGADPNAKSTRFLVRTALDFRYPELVALLLKHGAEPPLMDLRTLFFLHHDSGELLEKLEAEIEDSFGYSYLGEEMEHCIGQIETLRHPAFREHVDPQRIDEALALVERVFEAAKSNRGKSGRLSP